MRDLIYIIDDPVQIENEDAEQKSNNSAFNMDIIGALLNAASGVLPSIATPSALQGLRFLPIGINPISLLLALSVTSGPLIYTLYKSKDKEITSEEAKALELEINKLKVTKSKAKDLGYIFPPGHPINGTLYQIHPLAKYNYDKHLFYIPEKNYELTLTDERQSELIRILTDIGATKIVIKESYYTADGNESEKSGSVCASSAELEASGKIENNNRKIKHMARELKLLGKKITTGNELSTEKYNWYKFEPQWQSLVYARCFGGCIEATITMHEQKSLLSSSEIALALQSSLTEAIGAKGSSNSDTISNYKKSYVIQIEFNKPDPQA